MNFGIMFFADQPDYTHTEVYQLLIEATAFADRNGFLCVWTPERHFGGFGGVFPNPAVLSAALSTITQQIQLRTGSLIVALHDTLRVAEEWAVVDNLSHGRIALSFGSGWNVNDFVFFPERFTKRQNIMFQQIETIQALWQGGSVTRKNGNGKDIEIALHPKPVQARLPVWITSSGNVETMVKAGKIGANLLTHLRGQSIETLAEKISRYRAAYSSHNNGAQRGRVTLMLHTFLGPDEEVVKRTVKKPLLAYLRSAAALENRAALEHVNSSGNYAVPGYTIPYKNIPEDMLNDLLDITFERFYQDLTLIGTSEKCKTMVQRLQAIGVDEIACLIDFGVPPEEVMKSLAYLNELRTAFANAGI